ncbi:hypothetical protein ABLT32_00640 [Bacteroides pyogenes]|uniref:hypothetical protein n=1 Tax=Bacteroides pyogenes TaxID=310300 RepID=UPI004062F6E5
MMKTDLIKQIAKQTVNNIIFTAVFLLLATACRNDELVTSPAPNPPAGKDKAQVTIAIHIPGMRTPGTRAVNDETLGFPISVLAFKVEGGQEKLKFMKVFQTQFDPGAPNVNTGSNPFTMHLRGIDEGDYNRLCILTSTDATGKLTAGTSTFDNLKQLDITGGMDAATGQYVKYEIPMYGELKLATQNGISIKAGVSKVFTEEVKFLRAMARIEVKKQNGPGTVDAVLEKVYFCRSVKNGRIYGDKNNYTTTQNLPGSLEANITPVECGSISPANMTVEQNLSTPIYAYEQPASGTIGTDGARIIIKIAGIHSGFYPVDFIDDGTHGNPEGTPIPIRRNHKYLFNITAVNAPGYVTLEEALQSKEIFTNKPNSPITGNLITVPEDYKNITFNDANFLAVSETKFTLRGKHEATSTLNKLKIKTDYAKGWTISAYRGDGTPMPLDGWLKVSAYSANVPGESTISILNSGRGRKNGYLLLRAGRLTVKVYVDQPCKVPLEYVAEYNLAGGAQYQYYKPSLTPPHTDVELRWAANHENNQSGYYSWWICKGEHDYTYNPNHKNIFDDYFFTSGAGKGYHFPSEWEWRGAWGTSLITTYYPFTLQNKNEAMEIKGVKNTYGATYCYAGNGIFYALRFKKATGPANDGSGGNPSVFPEATDNSMACAYRYEFIGNLNSDNNTDRLKVQCVYLGDDSPLPDLVGEIATPGWWVAHAGQTITREFPATGFINGNQLHHRGKIGFYMINKRDGADVQMMKFERNMNSYLAHLGYGYLSGTYPLRLFTNE